MHGERANVTALILGSVESDLENPFFIFIYSSELCAMAPRRGARGLLAPAALAPSSSSKLRPRRVAARLLRICLSPDVGMQTACNSLLYFSVSVLFSFFFLLKQHITES